MVIKVRSKAQITLPNKIVKNLKINEGDEYEVVERNDGSILLVPVITYPRAYVDELEKEVKSVEAKLKDGTQPVFTSAEEMFKYLEKN